MVHKDMVIFSSGTDYGKVEIYSMVPTSANLALVGNPSGPHLDNISSVPVAVDLDSCMWRLIWIRACGG
jgi:hypothetical protein